MIKEKATVSAVRPHKVRVEINPAAGCAGCAEKAGCGTGMMQRWLNPIKQLWIPLNPEQNGQFAPGDRVELCVEEGNFVRSALLMFLLPMLGLVAGSWIGQQAGSDLNAVVGGLTGLFLSALLVRSVQRSHAQLLLGVPTIEACEEIETAEPLKPASVQV